MKKLLILIFILTTFLFLTSCDKDTPTDESSSETSKIEETSTQENIDDLNEEKLGYTFYQVKCELFYDNFLPKIIGTHEEFLNFIQEYVYDENSLNEIKSNIVAETFNDYFVMVMRPDATRLAENIHERTYKGFSALNDTVNIYIDSSYDVSITSSDQRPPKADFVLVPRKWYSDDLQSKTFYIYRNDYYIPTDEAGFSCIRVNMTKDEDLYFGLNSEENTETSNQPPINETKEDTNIIKYYTHYQAAFKEHLLTDDPPVIINNYNELSEFVERECLENSQNEVLSNITEKTFEEYFVLVMNDLTISPRHVEDLLERTYKNFTVTEDTVNFYISSYYPTCLIEAYVGIPSRDFVLIPRSLYSNDLQEKTFKIYIENYCEADDRAIVIYLETNKDGSQMTIIQGGDCGR